MNDNLLFPSLDSNTISRQENEKLAELMKKENGELESNIFAGFTYLGQMISHDIVASTNDSNARQFKVSPSLMLKSVYGNKKFRKKYQIFDDDWKFKFSNPKGKSSNKYSQMDLLRIKGKVVIPDKRNDENFIISQLHLFWQKFHNAIIENNLIDSYCQGACKKSNKVKNKSFNAFKIARELTIKTFQQIVIEDYLYNILNIEVYDAYIEKLKKNNGLFFYGKKYKLKQVPLEFSHAAFRFGHSMVRTSYEVNERSGTLTFDKLFNPKHKAISTKKLVNWNKFFGVESLNNKTIFASIIDDAIVDPMNSIPTQNRSIINLNLDAGFCEGLPSGIQILEYIQQNYDEVACQLKLDSTRYTGFETEFKSTNYSKLLPLKKIPLWLFILLEARYQKNDRGRKQQRLGKLGSVIVAEVIFQSIKQAKVSVLDKNRVYNNSENDFLSRLSLHLFENVEDSEELYIGLLDDFRRFKMIDLINLIPQIS